MQQPKVAAIVDGVNINVVWLNCLISVNCWIACFSFCDSQNPFACHNLFLMTAPVTCELRDVLPCFSESITFKTDMTLFEMIIDPDFCHLGTIFLLTIAYAWMLNLRTNASTFAVTFGTKHVKLVHVFEH